MSKIDWVPTPTFLYRNYLYERIVKKYPSDWKFLLVGTGTGYFIQKLLDHGFSGVGLDISKESIKVARKFLGKTLRRRLELKNGDLLKYRPRKKFDMVCCFEVLEHIDADEKAMKKICQVLKPGGKFVMSVPAHMSMWGKMDEMGGHVRRYEKKELSDKLEKAGFEIETLWSFGFPVLTAINRITRSGSFVKMFKSGLSESQKTQKSGIRVEYDPKFKALVSSSIILWPMFLVMNFFLPTDLGLGYLVVARKPLKA